MNNIKIFEKDLPEDIDLSQEKNVAIDCEALGLVLGRDPLTLIQIGLQSNKYYLIKLDRDNYNAPNLKRVLTNNLLLKFPLMINSLETFSLINLRMIL